MADFLVVGGIVLDVLEDGASEAAPIRIGQLIRSISGREGGAVRAEKQVRQFELEEMSQVAYDALRAATPVGRLITCSGEALGGSGLYRVTRRESSYVRETTGVQVYEVSLVLEEA